MSGKIWCEPAVWRAGLKEDKIHPEQRKPPEVNLFVLDMEFAKVFG